MARDRTSLSSPFHATPISAAVSPSGGEYCGGANGIAAPLFLLRVAIATMVGTMIAIAAMTKPMRSPSTSRSAFGASMTSSTGAVNASWGNARIPVRLSPV